jgi:hypothetical protein
LVLGGKDIVPMVYLALSTNAPSTPGTLEGTLGTLENRHLERRALARRLCLFRMLDELVEGEIDPLERF